MAVLLVVRLGLTAGLARQRAQALAQQASELEKALAEQENLQRLLSHHALHDPLTGLANRTLLTERIERALARRDAGAYLIMLDLDRFKDINDTHGHVVGDELLVAVAHRLLGRLAGTDTLARLGADQFAVLLENAGDVRAATVAAEAVNAIRVPYTLAGHTVRLSASAGVAALQPPLTASEVLRDADAAVEEAKRAGRNRVVTFEPALRSARLDHTRLALGLREALAGREFTLVYQPVVDLNTGQIKVVESLLRWTRATGEVVPPAQFIPVAEDTGLIMAIGAWVLGEACRRARDWFGAAGVAVSVNVSGHQLRDARFPALVAETLRDSGLPGQGLIIEITETALIAETGAEASAVRDRLERIRAMGVRVAIDDFGTGYSSLSYLRHLPAEILKIDKAFVQGDGGGTRSPRDRAFLRAILQLAGSVQLQAIAEGVETEEQARLLHMLGYPLAQGYLFHEPQTPEEIDELFTSGQATGIALTDRLSA
jgi:diguanylate cyclase (GGDEF)-like protein